MKTLYARIPNHLIILTYLEQVDAPSTILGKIGHKLPLLAGSQSLQSVLERETPFVTKNFYQNIVITLRQNCRYNETGSYWL